MKGTPPLKNTFQVFLKFCTALTRKMEIFDPEKKINLENEKLNKRYFSDRFLGHWRWFVKNFIGLMDQT